MKTLDHYNFNGKRALVRVDFNVPLNDKYEVTDQTRLKAALPTLSKILSDGGSVVLMSHLGRPKNGPEKKFSLQHVVPALEELLGRKVQFAENCIGDEAEQKAKALTTGEVLLLENLRFHKEETKGDEEFSKALAKLADVYVNDAFGTAHRAHASTTVVAQFVPDRLMGYLLQAELDNAQKVLEQAEHPFTAIMGGAKISDKILIIERLLDKVDNLLIGGAMAYTFIKARGGKIGNSLLEDDKVALAKELMQKAQAKNVNLVLPEDSVVAAEFKADAEHKIEQSDSISDGFMGLDIGPKAREHFVSIISDSKTILWNGPMGVFEMENFAKGTLKIAEAVAEATEENHAFSLIGGGDSAAAVNQLGFGERVSYVSTGGGALLEFMEGKELPGVQALK
jgi:phosphoglycerate kinase